MPRVYIECREDRAVTPTLQRRMVSDSPGTHVLSLDSSHSPFFSQPERLGALLCESLALMGSDRRPAHESRMPMAS